MSYPKNVSYIEEMDHIDYAKCEGWVLFFFSNPKISVFQNGISIYPIQYRYDTDNYRIIIKRYRYNRYDTDTLTFL